MSKISEKNIIFTADDDDSNNNNNNMKKIFFFFGCCCCCFLTFCMILVILNPAATPRFGAQNFFSCFYLYNKRTWMEFPSGNFSFFFFISRNHNNNNNCDDDDDDVDRNKGVVIVGKLYNVNDVTIKIFLP